MPLVVDKIFKGAKPADTPFEVINRQDFFVSQEMARGPGVTIPPEVLKRADRLLSEGKIRQQGRDPCLRNMVALDCHHEGFYTCFVAPCQDAAFEGLKG